MMRIRIDKWLVVLVVLALSTLSWWMPLEQGPVTQLVTPVKKHHVADFHLADFDMVAMNAAGRPRYHLQGRALSHYADDDTAQITVPQLTVYRRGAVPWAARAEQAQVAAGGETVWLRERVKVARLSEDQLEIHTSSLRVEPSKEYAETDQPVTIVTALGVTRGVGMEADLKRERLALLAQVRGEYAKQ